MTDSIKINDIKDHNIKFHIDDIKKDKNQIKLIAKKDSLTGLFNREFFLRNLCNKISKVSEKNIGNNEKERCAVLILGINEFREINNALGYSAGDKILKEVAQRISNSVGPKDMIARFGDDEFGVLLSDIISVEKMKNIINKILNKLNNLFLIHNKEIEITTNMGIAVYPDDGKKAISLVRKADIAMNKSKESTIGKPIKFEKTMDKEIQEQFWIKNDLSNAISNEELILNYQPIYDVDKDKLAGIEALVRWDHKEMGIISPSKFIYVAEKTGLIHSIGDWVLLNACKQNKKWQELGREPIYMSINISVLQLEQPGFFEIVEKILNELALKPEYLQLEITETFFAQDYELIKYTISKLSRLGIRLAIDDFGTGYSSLGQLCELNINNLNIDNLKIDRTLIDGVDKNRNKRNVVKAIISLAKSLNISLTVEGVETHEQLNFLKENGCSFIQGYLFSKPVNADEMEELLKN